MKTPQQLKAEEDALEKNWKRPILDKLEIWMDHVDSSGGTKVWAPFTTHISEREEELVLTELAIFGWLGEFFTEGGRFTESLSGFKNQTDG